MLGSTMSMSRTNSVTTNSITTRASYANGSSRDRLFGEDSDDVVHNHYLEGFLKVLSIILIVITCPISLIYCIAVVKEYERVVIFRMGRIAAGCPKGPGHFFVIPCLDTLVKVDLRTFNFGIPLAEVMLKDSIPISVEAVVYCKVCSVIIAVSHVEDYGQSARLMAASTLRKVMGAKCLADVLSDRIGFNEEMKSSINDATVRMGIRVERVELKTLALAPHLRRAMAVEGIATRDARAKYEFAIGERNASEKLAEAANEINGVALQLRFMQSLNSIQHNTDRSSTLFFTFPMQFNLTNPSESETED